MALTRSQHATPTCAQRPGGGGAAEGFTMGVDRAAETD